MLSKNDMSPRRSRRALPYLLAVLLALTGAASRAGQAPAGSARASSGSTAMAGGIRETVLPNGLTVLTKEMRNAPVASFSVWYRVGSRNEHTGITGVSHLLEHLMFKGTKKYGLGEISRTLFANGANFNAATYFDWTSYYATLASDRLELAMQIEADRMVNSRIDREDLQSEMTVVRSELEGRENDPGQLLFLAVAATAFQAHPYQWPIIGWRTDVENMPRDAIYDYYRRYYGPNNAVAVIVGDFETEAALALVRKHFGKIKPIAKPPEVYTQEPPQRGERRVTVRRAGSLPMTLVAFKAPPIGSPDAAAVEALQTVLGEGRTSRLYQALVETQTAAAASAMYVALRDPFLFGLSATARPGGTAEQLEKALLAEVEKVRTTPVSAEELERAKRQLEADFVFRNDSISDQAEQIGFWEMEDDWRSLTTYVDRIRALTPADLQRAAQKYLVADARTVGHFIPTSEAAPPAAPPQEGAARVERPRRGEKPVSLPKPVKTPSVSRSITRFKLENRITVVVQENRANPTVAINGSLRAGSVLEPADKPGVAALTASMLTRGTEKRSALQFATALESVGARLSASADELKTSLGGRAQTKDFDLLIELLAEMLRQPAFPQADLERLKGQVLAGLEQEKEDPAGVASRAFGRALYPEGNPLRPETLEELQRSIQGITRDDVARFYGEQYGPEGMILAIAGDVSAERVRQALQSRLGDWPRNPRSRPLPELALPLQEKPVRQVIRMPDRSEAAILWGHAGGLKRSDPDFYAVMVLDMILGGGGALNSRLGNTIRDEQGLAYTVYSTFLPDLYPGPFQITLGTNPTNASRAAAGVEAEVRRMREAGVTQREVEEAVAYLTGSFPLRLESNAGMAQLLWTIEYYGLGPEYLEKRAEHYRAVTVDQVNAAAKKYLHPDRGTLVIVGTVPEP